MKRNLLLTLTLFCCTMLWSQTPGDTVTIPQFIVGYTQMDARTVGSAVEKVESEQMRKGLVTSSLDALSGQAAGVQVQTGGNQEAMVSAVRVRGTTSLTGGNDPLIIIDGVASDLATLSTIYPADIESFTILKDASQTAQYGSRGAAGVIEVATKKGKSGNFHISYDGTMGFESVYKNMEMLSGDEFRQAAIALKKDIIDGGGNTNYADAITRTGIIQNHHIAFGGGTESSNYRASVGVMDHRTVIRTNRNRNYIAKLDISQRAFDDHVTFDLGVFGSIQRSNRLPFARKLLYSAAAFNPTILEGRNAAGGYDQVPEAVWINNPLSLLEMESDNDNGHFNAHLRAMADLGYGIHFTAFGSYSYKSDNNAHFYPTFVWSQGEAYRADTRDEEIFGNISLEKTFKTEKHFLKLMALCESKTTTSKGFNVTSTGFNTNAFGYHNLSAGTTRPWEGTGSFYQDTHLGSFLFMANYSFRERVSLTANARTDGSSMVGKNHRWGFFPSISGSWIVWGNNKPHLLMDYLKIRAGYGLSGNLGGIDAYNSLQMLQPNGIVNIDGGNATTLALVRNANPDLKWEVKHTFNAGINTAFWNRRIVLSLDYYYSRITDMLYMYDVPVPPFIYNKMLANLGKMENSGFEIGFGITALQSKDIDLSIDLNMSFERNKLISLNGYYNGQYLTAPSAKGLAALSGAGLHGSSDVVSQIVGQPLGVFNLPHCSGLTYDENGAKHYEITSEPRICGQAMPKMRMSSNIAFRYRLFDISLQLNGAFGHHIYNGTALAYMNMLSLPNYNVMKDAPKENIQDQTISDYWLERGDYVNVDYVTFGWNVPEKSKFIQRLRLSASINNLLTITGYSGLTPMINSSVVNSTLGVDDKSSLPVYRSYAMGLSIQF
ncbi:MAG: SusC/RagA family TonB-linked outer membrane protein [Prevotella sp.]|nr:SusC/RagA family TonB-linked outer membrane protein [Prevotella sp.]